MIHVAIDTSALEDNKSLNDANYKALKRLVDSKIITIHIPYIVKKEIETQEKELYLETYKQLKTSLRKFDRVRKNKDIDQKINQIKTQFDELESSIFADAENFSKQWAEGLNSQICELNQSQTSDAWDAYFNGAAPLTSKKERQDIPDSFICRGIENIQRDVTDLVVLAKDKKIFNTFNNKPNYEVHKTIREFVESAKIQEELEELDTIRGSEIFKNQIQNLIGFIHKFELTTNLIKSYLKDNIGKAIIDSSVYGVPLSNEMDGEATISSYSDGLNINLNLDKAIHYGENQFGFDFELEVEVFIDYYIDKSEYYMSLADHEHEPRNVSIDDWNDHVFQAESDVNVAVKGTVSIKIDTSNVDFAELAKCEPEELDDYLNDIYCESQIKIESIESIEII